MAKEKKIKFTVCFTGHRRIPSGEHETLAARLRAAVIRLIERGYRYFGVGGALGFDTLAAKTILELKGEYPHIKLILVLPCKNQTPYWNSHDKRIYDDICRLADKVTCLYEKYEPGCMHARNRHLVENSSVCVCYHTHSGGGTDYTVFCAQNLGLEIINLAG